MPIAEELEEESEHSEHPFKKGQTIMISDAQDNVQELPLNTD